MLRSLAINSLKEEGMGKASMEPQILEEIDEFLNHYVEPHVGAPITLSHSLSKATSNIITQMMFARRFRYEDEKFNKMVSAVQSVVRLALKAGMVSCLPFGKYFSRSIVEKEIYVRKEVLWPIIQSYIDEHEETIDRDEPRDVIDRFLIHSTDSQKDAGGCYEGMIKYIYY